ncbi:golgin subfamily A member 6-like protein 22 [Palaemon carinicauda]|uniref:golgin subfamily A member 6-like protein 22 n=1 Tax=Palaemon carinicauda TaxID=392227 RepID=UPI0035B6841F
MEEWVEWVADHTGISSLRQQADQDKRKNDELRNKKLSLERKFQGVQEENDYLRKEVGTLRESQLQREEDNISRQGFEEKQKDDLEGKPQDERKLLRREAKDVALIRIRKIAQEEISQEKSDKVYAPVQLWEEALKDEKTEKKQKVNLEEIEEGIVKRRIRYFENIMRGNIKEEGDLRENIIQGDIKEEGNLCGQSPDLRKNLNRKAKDIALARISQIIQEELSGQNEKVWKSENAEKELHDYQEAKSPGTQGDSASNCDDYVEIRMINIMGEKQKADLEGKPQDEKKHLRREAKEVALIRIRKIAQDEISQEKSDKVYALVQLWEEALKDEKTEKKQKVNLEEIEEGIVNRRIQYFENIVRGNLKEEGDFHTQSPESRENLNRKAEDIALARITQIIQEELSEEQNENVWRSENSEKEIKDYQEANSPGTKGNFASKGEDYEEIIKVNVMGRKQKADLEEISQDERKLLRREAKEVALIRIKQIVQDEISQEKSDIVNGPVQLWEEALKHEKTEKKQKINLEEIEVGIVERRIQYFENITRGNMKEGGDHHGQSWDLRNHLERAAKDVASTRIRNILQKVIKENFDEQNGCCSKEEIKQNQKYTTKKQFCWSNIEDVHCRGKRLSFFQYATVP